MEQYKVTQLSLPDYDTLKENVQIIYDTLKANHFLVVQAKAALLALSIMFKVELDSLLTMWYSIVPSNLKWTKEQILMEEVHMEMIRQFAEYLGSFK